MNASLRMVARRTCTGVAVVSAAFCLIVALLIGASAYQSLTSAPLDSPGLEVLRQQLRSDPRDEALQEEIRALDLLARRAHFSSVGFRRTGVWLLLGGALILLTSLRLRAVMDRCTPDARRLPARPDPVRVDASIRWGVGTLIGVALLALLLWVLVQRGGEPANETAAVSTPGDSGPAVAMEHWQQRRSHHPAFRGADGLGVATAAVDPPTTWDGASGENIRWRTAIPRRGFSSPVVWGDQVFLTGADGDERELYAFDADDGELGWRRSARDVPGSPLDPPPVTDDTGFAAPTPAVDGTRVFALFATGDLIAVYLDGSPAWELNLGVPENPYGHAASLLVYQNLLMVQFDHQWDARVIALDGATGDTVWETVRDVQVSWSSPVLVPAPAGPQLVLNGHPFAIGYDPELGQELWRVECMSGEVAVSPAWFGDTVYLANEYARLVAIRPESPAQVVWEVEEGDFPEVSSPLATEQHLYLAHGSGVLNGYRRNDGELLWRQEFDEGFYASPVLAAGRVYLMDRSGRMRIFADAPAYQELSAPALGEISTATPAFVGNRMFLRGNQHLFCVEVSP